MYLCGAFYKNKNLDSQVKKNAGIYYMLLASFAFALMGVFVKRLGKDFDTVEIVFFRNLLGVTFILISYFKSPFTLEGNKPWLLLFRGLIGTISLYAFAYNLTHVSLGEAFTYFQTSTLFIAIFSYFILKEKMNIASWSALLLGFLGIITVFRPDIGGNWKNNVMGLTNGLLSAAAYMSVSELKKHYDTRAIILVFMGWGILLPLCSMGLGEFYQNEALSFMISRFKMPYWSNAFDIVLVGFTALLGQIYATRAYGAEKAGIVSAISYSNVVFSIILGIFIGDKFPDAITFIGMIMIIGSGVMISLFKN
jgi:drug/metabolite transporter (DMT)-like permease